jgi:hypothetical protein
MLRTSFPFCTLCLDASLQEETDGKSDPPVATLLQGFEEFQWDGGGIRFEAEVHKDRGNFHI